MNVPLRIMTYRVKILFPQLYVLVIEKASAFLKVNVYISWHIKIPGFVSLHLDVCVLCAFERNLNGSTLFHSIHKGIWFSNALNLYELSCIHMRKMFCCTICIFLDSYNLHERRIYDGANYSTWWICYRTLCRGSPLSLIPPLHQEEFFEPYLILDEIDANVVVEGPYAWMFWNK